MEITYRIDEIDKVAGKILAFAKAKCIIFNAPMGSGKTTLIKALCRHLGVKDDVSSPTFSLVNEYHGKDCAIYHFDLYRIENPIELVEIGIEEYLDNDHHLFVEWPEYAIPYLENYLELHISSLSDTQRSISLKNY